MLNFSAILNCDEMSRFLENIKNNKKQIVLNAPNDLKAVLVGLLKKRFVFVAKDMVSASRFAEQLKYFNLPAKLLLTPFENNLGLVDASFSMDFYSAMFSFFNGETCALIISVDSLFQKVPTLQELIKNTFSLIKNHNYNFKALTTWLLSAGFNRVENISMRGQFSLRGDILEIFPINKESIYKIEFFDTIVERISIISPEERKFISEEKDLVVLGVNHKKFDLNLLGFAAEINNFLKKIKPLNTQINNLESTNCNEVIKHLLNTDNINFDAMPTIETNRHEKKCAITNEKIAENAIQILAVNDGLIKHKNKENKGKTESCDLNSNRKNSTNPDCEIFKNTCKNLAKVGGFFEEVVACFDEPVQLETMKTYFVKSNIFQDVSSLDENAYNAKTDNKTDKVNFTNSAQNPTTKTLENCNNCKAKNFNVFMDENQIFACEIEKQIAFASIQGKCFFKADDIVPLKTLATKKYVFDFAELVKDIKYHTELGNNVLLFCGNMENKLRLEEFLNQNLIFSAEMPADLVLKDCENTIILNQTGNDNSFKNSSVSPSINVNFLKNAKIKNNIKQAFLNEKFSANESFQENMKYRNLQERKLSNNFYVTKFNKKLKAKKLEEAELSKIVLNQQDDRLSSFKPAVFLLSEFLPFSFCALQTKCLVVGTYDLFKKKENKTKSGKNTVFYTPQVGDFVVHETHGIGRCVSVEKLKLIGVEKDYFVIEYAGGDKFYLPSENADTIAAYYGGEGLPKLNKLGGADFSKLKEKVYKNVKQLAFDLLELYAKREKSLGFIYQKDDYLMEMFENSFPYQETPDQISAIADIKKDMESSRIMDRLICGDVGYGKTEVALRAIYKAVLSGKQVAFLCPTTILAEQHYKTCLKRFSGFMVKVSRLNRLVPAAQQQAILKGLASGEINIVCGTHKLLSKDVQFKNLGLLVLDEEQRFGVEDKEKIKNIKNNIDILTLSATPIPRTLHMSLSGIRDISIIDTPPKERIPVQTFVIDYTDNLLVGAVKNELSRGGQVLIVFNRVEFIYDFAAHVRKLLPNVRVGVAHGQLSQKMLEEAIMKLYSGEFDILIATTLIENGIDLPTANTLIVVEADKLGLSALYQLRGRIGRSDKVAYAYFTYDANKVLTEGALKRLEAIMEFTELGSGFKIAMRDLEIRGAGNVLGKQQHGALEKVGYDLYCKLLNDAVKELKGEKVEKRTEVRVDVNLNAFISENYILEETERIKKYTQISCLNSQEEVKNFIAETQKNHGPLPLEFHNLIMIAWLKNLLGSFGITRIYVAENCTNVFFAHRDNEKALMFSKQIKAAGLQNVWKSSSQLAINFNELSIKSRVEKLCNILS